MAVLFLSLLAMATLELLDPDFFWHLRTGQLIWETGSIPRVDPFSYTIPGQPWTAHEWLSEVIFYAVYLRAGQEGLILFFALIITLTFGIVYYLSDGKPYLAGLGILLAALASAVAWGVRPQMFTMLLAAATVLILVEYRKGKRNLVWFLPLLMVLWVNMHGGYLLGLALVGMYLLGLLISRWLQQDTTPIRPLVLAFVFSFLATLVTPHGPGFLLYPWATLASPTMQSYILEWLSPDFHLVQFQPYALLLLLTFVSMALSRRPADPIELLLLSVFGYASLRSARNIPLFAVVAGPILSRHLWAVAESRGWANRLSPQATTNRVLSLLNWILLLAAATGAAVKISYTLGNNQAAQSRLYPVAAVEYMEKEGLFGLIYNQYEWGGYLIWRLYPEQKVYIDGRADVYGDAYIEEYLDAYRMREDWQEPLQKYEVNILLIDRNSPLANHLQADPGWEQVYRDPLALILVKRSPP